LCRDANLADPLSGRSSSPSTKARISAMLPASGRPPSKRASVKARRSAVVEYIPPAAPPREGCHRSVASTNFPPSRTHPAPIGDPAGDGDQPAGAPFPPGIAVDRIGVEVLVQAAGVLEELPRRDAGRVWKIRGVVLDRSVQIELPLPRQLRHHDRDEGLGGAPDDPRSVRVDRGAAAQVREPLGDGERPARGLAAP